MATDANDPAPVADRSNWREAPYSRWGFHHVADLLPTAVVSRGAGETLALPPAPRSFGDFEIASGGAQTLDFEGFLKAADTDACVVLHEGKLVYETYRHGNAEDRPHILMSATKAVVGLVSGILADTGALDLDAEVETYVPEIALGPYKGALVRHLLDMRTGVALDDAERAAYVAAANWDPPPSLGSPASLKMFLAGLRGPPAAHGGRFAYVSANTDLLGWVLERASGRTVSGLVSDLLWSRIGAEEDAYFTTDDEGLARSTGGLCATARDFARIGQLMVDGGVREGRVIAPHAVIDDIETQGDLEAWRTGEFAQAFASATMRYRSGWYVIDDAPKTLFAMGIHGQNFFVDRVNNIVFAKFSSVNNPIDFRVTPLIHRGYHALRRSLLRGPG